MPASSVPFQFPLQLSHAVTQLDAIRLNLVNLLGLGLQHSSVFRLVRIQECLQLGHALPPIQLEGGTFISHVYTVVNLFLKFGIGVIHPPGQPPVVMCDLLSQLGHALLQGVGRQHVRLDLAGTRYDIARDSLAKFWDGDFIVLWRLPADIPATLDRGASGSGVAWVADRLKTYDGTTASSTTFDAALEERVRQLQQGYGIKADGIIGPETLFALSALDDAGPHLARTVD